MNATFSVIGAPSSAGAHMPGQERGPQALREAGLLQRLNERFDRVRDLGDLATVRHRPDKSRRRHQNSDRVLEVARSLAELIETAADDGGRLLVMGGDCTISLGVVSGLLRRSDNLGIIYLDAHGDLNTPPTSVSGAMDSMGMAHLLAEAGTVAEIARMGPRYPLMQPKDVLFFGFEPEEMNPVEHETFERRGLGGYTAAEVRADPVKTARSARSALEAHCGSFLVHFDVDVLDFVDCPLANIPTINRGLELGQVLSSLEVFAASPGFAGLVITELNPGHADEAGETLRKFVNGICDALAAEPQPSQ
jgi:arginase